jgi:hypothetical protein
MIGTACLAAKTKAIFGSRQCTEKMLDKSNEIYLANKSLYP